MSGELAAPTGPRPLLPRFTRRALLVAFGVSAALHLSLLLALTGWFRRTPLPPPAGSPTVELIMQTAPDVHFSAPPATPPARQTQATPAPATPTPIAPTPTPELPEPTPPALSAVPMPPPPPPKPRARPAPPKLQEATPLPPDDTATASVNLGESGFAAGIASGQNVVAAAPDAAYHNLPPHYPPEARSRREQGAVTLLIHVAPEGTASGVDITTSSGFAVLDRAARDAVLRWHFHPEEKDGIPVASDFPFRIIFDLTNT